VPWQDPDEMQITVTSEASNSDSPLTDLEAPDDTFDPRPRKLLQEKPTSRRRPPTLKGSPLPSYVADVVLLPSLVRLSLKGKSSRSVRPLYKPSSFRMSRVASPSPVAHAPLSVPRALSISESQGRVIAPMLSEILNGPGT
jgi:hypothetical protein